MARQTTFTQTCTVGRGHVHAQNDYVAGGSTVIYFLHTIFSLPFRIWLTVFLFVCRALIAGAFQALYVYTPEVYPTRVRALGLGMSSTVGRIGGIISPYIAQVRVLTVLNCDNPT